MTPDFREVTRLTKCPCLPPIASTFLIRSSLMLPSLMAGVKGSVMDSCAASGGQNIVPDARLGRRWAILDFEADARPASLIQGWVDGLSTSHWPPFCRRDRLMLRRLVHGWWQCGLVMSLGLGLSGTPALADHHGQNTSYQVVQGYILQASPTGKVSTQTPSPVAKLSSPQSPDNSLRLAPEPAAPAVTLQLVPAPCRSRWSNWPPHPLRFRPCNWLRCRFRPCNWLRCRFRPCNWPLPRRRSPPRSCCSFPVRIGATGSANASDGIVRTPRPGRGSFRVAVKP